MEKIKDILLVSLLVFGFVLLIGVLLLIPIVGWIIAALLIIEALSEVDNSRNVKPQKEVPLYVPEDWSKTTSR